MDWLYYPCIDDFECEGDDSLRNHSEDAKVFKAFCDENRLRVLEILRSGEKCACVLLEDLQISQSTLSHHMKILCDSGIVDSHKEGKWTHYAISPAGSQRALALLQVLTGIYKGPQCSCCQEEPEGEED